MTELSNDARERSRKAHASLLQAMQDPGTARTLALVLGVSESTISRTKADADGVIALLYQLGFKVVAQDAVCVDRQKLDAVLTLTQAALCGDDALKRLVVEDGK